MHFNDYYFSDSETFMQVQLHCYCPAKNMDQSVPQTLQANLQDDNAISDNTKKNTDKKQAENGLHDACYRSAYKNFLFN